MIVIIDNTHDLSKAYMTPKIIKFLESKEIRHQVISSYGNLSIPDLSKITGVIFCGGPLMLSGEVELRKIQTNLELFIRLLELDPQVPILAICFGYQLVALFYGGEIAKMPTPHYGKEKIVIDPTSPIFKGIASSQNSSENELEIFNHHEDYLKECPKGFRVIAHTSSGEISGIEHGLRPIYGFQFHPEALESSQKILDNFISLCIDREDAK